MECWSNGVVGTKTGVRREAQGVRVRGQGSGVKVNYSTTQPLNYSTNDQ